MSALHTKPHKSDKGKVEIEDTIEQEQLLESESSEIDKLNKLVGNRIKQIRKSQKLTRRELSESSKVSTRYLAKLESGEGNITIAVLKKLSSALTTPVNAFLTEVDPLASEISNLLVLFRQADAVTRARVIQLLDPERMTEDKAQRLCLVGLRGAGKSTLGELIGKQFDAEFIELNKKIEDGAGMPVGEIIALYGQEGYRKLEADTLSRIVDDHSRAVIAVPGGIVSEQETFSTLISRFHAVWIKASPEEHMERVRAQGDMRPMEGNPMAMRQLRQILQDRETSYVRADHVIDTSGKTVLESYSDLLQLVQSIGVLDARPTRRQIQ